MKPLLNSLYRYPLILITLCYGAGIALSVLPVAAPATLITGAAVLLLLSFTSFLLRLNGLVFVTILFCFLIIGIVHGNQHRSTSPGPSTSEIMTHGNPDMVILATVNKIVVGDGLLSRAVLAVHYYRTEKMSSFQTSSGLLLLRLKGRWPRTIQPGDRVAVRAVISKPGMNNTPGVFNYPDYLANQKIYLTATVASPLLIQPVQIASHPVRLSFAHRLERIRTEIAFRLDELLPANAAGLYRALLIGDKSAIKPPILESFKGSGVMHILAISGMHLALLGFLLFQAVFWTIRRSTRALLALNARKISLLFCLVPLLGYTLLAGAAAPVVRSFIMAVLVIGALSVNRVKSPLTLLAGAGFVILVLDPLALESVSFQLSFSAVASIVLIAPVIFSRFQTKKDLQSSAGDRLRVHLNNWLWGAVSITVGATIGTFPILLYHFNRFSLTGIPANLIIEPLICLWALPLGFLALPFLTLYPPLALVLLNAGSVGLSLSVKAATLLSSMTFSTLWLPDPPLWLIALYFPVLLLLIVSMKVSRFRRLALICFLVCLCLFFQPLSGFRGILRQDNRVTFVDMGHGSASLIELAGGRTILVDAGGKSAPGFNSGERILAPFLWHHGIARLDDIIISHADADHYNAVPALLSRFKPKRIWLPSLASAKPGFNRLCDLAAQAGVKLQVPDRGILISEKGTEITVVSPLQEEQQEQWLARSEDDNGLVIRLDTPDFSVLLPGDITKNREWELVVGNAPLAADILLSPHHGSSTSNSVDFLAAVKPKFMVVSASKKGNNLFPSAQTVENAAQQDIRVLITGKDGTISVTGSDMGFTVRGYQSADGGAKPREKMFFPLTPR